MAIGGVGRHSCSNMWIWQVQSEYYYSPSLSGGPNMLLYGGNVDQESAIVYQRYHFQGKAHYRSGRYDLFIGPVLGFDNTDLQELRKELSDNGDDETVDPDTTLGNCSESYGAQGLSIGYEAGMGALFNEDWALSVGQSFAYTTGHDTQFSVSVALAYNLWNRWERLRSSLQDTWIVLEWRSDLSVGSLSPLNSLVLGLSLGI